MFDVKNLSILKKEMKTAGIDAYIIFTADPHDSEYVADRFLSERLYFCPFSGSAGKVLITLNNCYLFTDGRYWLQAEKQLKDSGIELIKEGKSDAKSIYKIIQELGLKSVATNFEMISLETLNNYKNNNINLVDKDFSYLVEDMPSLSKNKLFKLDENLFSITTREKIERILEATLYVGADANLITNLDDIAFILNVRGNDIPCNPVFYSYLYLSNKVGNFLFIDPEKIDFELEGIKVLPYEEVFNFLNANENIKTLVDTNRTNAKICNNLKNIVKGRNPSFLMKAIKGEAEVNNTIRIQAIDGLAIVKFWKYLETNLSKNLNEYNLSEQLKKFRFESSELFDLSFDTIAAVDSNAAQMHYEPTKEKNSVVNHHNMILLVDSGGQYYGGTTDTTRMFNFGKLTKEYVKDYTLTLKSVIALTQTIFLEGVSGNTIDMRARQFMWNEGMDYKCGTGHGVGYMLNVHEGPNNFRPKTRPGIDNGDAIVPGMITTVEPGVYKEGKYGIRIENNLLCVPAFETSDGKFFKFETITYCPIDTRGLDLNLLTEDEIEWLNKYHDTVYKKLSLLTSDKDLIKFLKDKTAKIYKNKIKTL